MYFSKSNEKRFINTYKNNNKDSIWSSLTYPSLINSKDFVNPYVKADSPEMKQWEYISDSKYVSKIIETIYWAYCWSNEQKKRKFMDTILKKVLRMSDYMLYFINSNESLQEFNVESKDDDLNYLVSRYFSWKGDIHGKWLTKKVSSNIIGIGSQNPLVAYILSNIKEFKSDNEDIILKWKKTYKRQIEFIRWLQSSEGAIVGNAIYISSSIEINKVPTFYNLVFSNNSNEEENNLFSKLRTIFNNNNNKYIYIFIYIYIYLFIYIYFYIFIYIYLYLRYSMFRF